MSAVWHVSKCISESFHHFFAKPPSSSREKMRDEDQNALPATLSGQQRGLGPELGAIQRRVLSDYMLLVSLEQFWLASSLGKPGQVHTGRNLCNVGEAKACCGCSSS